MTRSRGWAGASCLGAFAATIGSFAWLCGSPSRAAPPAPHPTALAAWEGLLSRRDTGVEAWHRKPASGSDGRGVVIAILDTGIDPATPGLHLGTDGRHRIVALRDFSGQGHVQLQPSRSHGADPLVHETAAGRVTGFPGGHTPPSQRGDDRLWLGFFSEATIGDTAARDLDRDGRTDGRFAVAMWLDPTDRKARAVVDLDGDGRFDDDPVFRSWEDDPRPFHFRSKDPARNLPPVNFGLHLDPRRERVEFHFDDGGHGTHCAGIAAGRGIAGQEGFDGVAPEARLMSLKIGDNRRAGGATTDGAMLEAVKFASQWARENATPVVMNLSYGIAARTEGFSSIESLIDAELAANPLLLLSVSASNDGPGLSTVGNPAGTRLGFTVGAMLPSEQAEVLYGATGGRRSGLAPAVFAFSSRGGELAKPDAVAPGIAFATVPPFHRRNVMAGTSMAAPHVAGIMALLVSRAQASGLTWTPFDIKRSLAAGARPLPGAAWPDQGAGLVDIQNAWKYLTQAVTRKDAAGDRHLAGYRVDTPIPHRPGHSGSASFWRIGGDANRGRENVVFKVAPIFHTAAGDAETAGWFGDHQLTSDSAWVRVDRRRVIMRGAASIEIHAQVDFDAVANTPGLHVAVIRAATARGPAFVLPVIVIVPLTFDSDGGFAASGRLSPGAIARLFVEAPWPPTSVATTFSAAGPGRQEAVLLAHGPTGFAPDAWTMRHTTDGAPPLVSVWNPDDFSAGIHELVIHAPVRNNAEITWDLALAAGRVDGPDTLSYRLDTSRIPLTDLRLTHQGRTALKGDLSVILDGYEQTHRLESGAGEANHRVAIGPDSGGVHIEIRMPDSTWDRMTDIAVEVLDPSGKSIRNESFGGERLVVELPATEGVHTIQIRGARADANDGSTSVFHLTERHNHREPILFPPTKNGRMTLYPGVPTPFELKASAPLPELPDGFRHVGLLRVTERSGAVALEKRVVFKAAGR